MLAYVGLSAAAHTGKHYGRNTGRPLVVRGRIAVES